MKTMTRWFKPAEKPVREGVYQTADRGMLESGTRGYQYWNGKWWGYYNTTPSSAYRERSQKSGYQRNYWRGLADKPEGEI
jgi:hypothetical protein